MRRLLLLLTAAALLLGAPAAASAAAPFTAGTGDRPQVAVGPDGTGYVAWMTRSATDDGDLVGYCRVPRGGTACDRMAFIPFPGAGVANGGDVAQVFADPADASRVVLMASCWNCGAGGTTNRVYVRGSTDGGATFGLPAEIGGGLVVGGQSAWLGGAAPLLLGIGGSRLLAMNGSPPATSTVTFTASGIIATPAVSEVHGTSQLLAVSSNMAAVRFAVYAGPFTATAVNMQASWLTDQPVVGATAGATETSLASGPSGTFLAYRRAQLGDDRARLHRYDPVARAFDAGRDIEGTEALDADVLEPDLAQDAVGRLHAVWRSGLRGGRLRYRRSDDAGASFSPAGNLAMSEPFGEPEVAAAPDGTGFAVWNGASGAVRVVVLDPQPEPADAPRPPAPRVDPPPAPPEPAAPRAPAELQVSRLVLDRHRDRFRVAASVRREATGTVRIRLRAAGRTRTFDAPIVRGRIALPAALPLRMARARTGRVALRYAGDSGVAAESVSLRAGRRPARLRPARPVLDSGRLRARGTLTRVARRRVTLRVAFVADGAYRTYRTRARIAHGRYSINERLPAPLRSLLVRRAGPVRVTTTYAGRPARGVHGEQRVATATVR